MERSTRQREAILRTFEAIDRPLSPIEILSSAKKRVPRLGIATVYRPEFLMEIASSIRKSFSSDLTSRIAN